VLFIAVDDLNHWVGYLGRNAQTKTPNIDRLAARGVWFTRSYCAAPACNPSRAALLSGLRPSASGVYDNQDTFTLAIPPEITLPTAFRKAGYYVCGAGKIYHGSAHRPEEWNDYLRKLDRRSEDRGPPASAGKLDITPLGCADEAMPDYAFVSYGIEQLNTRRDRPLFVAVGLVKPHLPWSVPKKYYDLHPLDTIELPPYYEDDLKDIPSAGLRMANAQGDHAAIVREGVDSWRKAVQAYLASISFCDAMVGRLLDGLDKSPCADNTIICFWSDHGWHLGEKHHWRKFALWEEATRAPLILVAPGLTKANSRCDRPVDFMSIYPTLTDLCNIPTPAHVQGRSLRPLLADPKAPWAEPALTTYRYMNHAVRSEQWRYIRYADGGEELYDASRDPYEWTNLAARPDAAKQKAELAKWLPKQNQPAVVAPAPSKEARAANRPGSAKAKASRRAKGTP
jgi:arylsulfatase A-like enzyme